MGFGLMSFLGGVGQGAIQERNYEDQRAREARLDQITSDAAAQQAQLRQLQIDQENQRWSDTQGARAAAQQANGQPPAAPSAPQAPTDPSAQPADSSSGQADPTSGADPASFADMDSSGQDAPAAAPKSSGMPGGGATQAPQSGGAAPVPQTGGAAPAPVPTSAAAGAAAQQGAPLSSAASAPSAGSGFGMSNADNLMTKAQAAVNFYTKVGNVAAAQQAQQQLDAYRQNQFDMQRQLIYQHAIQTYQQGGIQPVLAQFNQFYAAGSPAAVEAGPNGTQQIVRRDSKGNMVGQPMPLSSDADFASDIYSMIFPDKVAQARMAMQAKLAEINATPKAVPNGGSIFQNGRYVAGAPPKQFAPTEPRQVKPGDTPQGQLNTMVNDLSKNADAKLSPDQLATAQDQAQRIFANNPSTPLHTAARFGVDIAMHPERITPAINMRNGTIDSAYTDPQTGAQITMRTGVGTPTNLPQGMTPDMAKQQTDQMLQKMEVQSPGSTKLFINAAADPKQLPSLQQYVQQQVTQALQKQPAFGGLSPAQKQAAIDQAMQTEMSSVQNKLALIQQFGPKPAQQRTGGGSQSLFSGLGLPQATIGQQPAPAFN